MHWESFRYIGEHALGLPADRILEIGSLVVNGSPRFIFPECREYVGIDLIPGLGVDHVISGADPHLAERVGYDYDLVICAEVLEHTPEGEAIMRNARNCLREGGTLIVTAAGPNRPVHSFTGSDVLQPGEYYGGVTNEQLAEWLTAAGLAYGVIEYARGRQDVYATVMRPPE